MYCTKHIQRFIASKQMIAQVSAKGKNTNGVFLMKVQQFVLIANWLKSIEFYYLGKNQRPPLTEC